VIDIDFDLLAIVGGDTIMEIVNFLLFDED
jgi:hypothetical protein